jgi:carboxyl-terminal processing protease
MTAQSRRQPFCYRPGTSGAAELFASALTGNQRADLIGEHTIGRAAQQKLIKLPDGAGLWLSTSRFLTPSGAQLHEKGLEPTVAVEEPDVAEFGGQPPARRSDPGEGAGATGGKKGA